MITLYRNLLLSATTIAIIGTLFTLAICCKFEVEEVNRFTNDSHARTLTMPSINVCIARSITIRSRWCVIVFKVTGAWIVSHRKSFCRFYMYETTDPKINWYHLIWDRRLQTFSPRVWKETFRHVSRSTETQLPPAGENVAAINHTVKSLI